MAETVQIYKRMFYRSRPGNVDMMDLRKKDVGGLEIFSLLSSGNQLLVDEFQFKNFNSRKPYLNIDESALHIIEHNYPKEPFIHLVYKK